MGRDTLTILIGGEAGQGLVTIGELMIRCLVRSGYHVLSTQSYQSRIRGGHNLFVIRTGVSEIKAPNESVDLLLALNQETIDLHQGRLNPGGLVIGDEALNFGEDGALKVPFKALAEGRYFNIAALGVVAAVIGLEQSLISSGVEKTLGEKHSETLAKNQAALDKAYAWRRENPIDTLALTPVRSHTRRLAMNGNEAIALGALAAGVRFCAFYPMTPSTSIALNLAAWAEKMGLVVEQAEDEIACINMSLGASYAGAPSMITTSGGGFALMCEGVAVAGMMETPVVLAIAQRPGPATGLPTRTEQAELEFVLHAGHGEFPRAIFAPGSVEECFHLTRRAFDLAERFQTPCFILTDQFLADSHRDVIPFDLDAGPEVHPAANLEAEFAKPYQRYAFTETGVSPRLLPGLSENLVVTDSDEHTPDGHLTEDLSVRVQMNQKRLRKLDGLKKEALPPEWSGEDKPDLLFVSWGSSRGSVLQAAETLRSQGRKTACLHFSQVWPIIPDHFVGRLKEAAQVVAVEGNAFGQMARLIRRETGFGIDKLVLRYDGLPLTPEYILRALAEMGM